METPTALAVVQPAELVRQATDVAGLCKEIALRTSVDIQGRKYVRVEGWMAIATAHGCVASSGEVETVENGTRAIAEIRKIADGAVICSAEGFVGKDEPLWYGGPDQIFDKAANRWKDITREKRSDYAIRAMAQTRAVSRACRTAFAHVVVMMDAGLQTTPAEEVPADGFTDHPAPAGKTEKVVSPPTGGAGKSDPVVPRDPTANAARVEKYRGGKWEKVVIHWGKNKGATLGSLTDRQLSWYVNDWIPQPYNGTISEADLEMRAALDAALETFTE